jgi:hypothetical protein
MDQTTWAHLAHCQSRDVNYSQVTVARRLVLGFSNDGPVGFYSKMRDSRPESAPNKKCQINLSAALNIIKSVDKSSNVPSCQIAQQTYRVSQKKQTTFYDNHKLPQGKSYTKMTAIFWRVCVLSLVAFGAILVWQCQKNCLKTAQNVGSV